MEEKKHIAKEEKAPSMLTMIKSFSRDLKLWIKEGTPCTTPADYIERLTACKACPHIKKDLMRCGKCGCLVEHKAKWRTTACPDDPPRWKPQNVMPQTKAEERHRVEQRQKKQEHEEYVRKQKSMEEKMKKDQEGYTDFEEIPDPSV